MAPDDGPHENVESADDPSELIVGTIRPPPWLDAIPTRAWLFIALAALDAAYRIVREAPWSAVGVSGTDWAGLGLSMIGGAAIVALPAAILIGRPPLGRAGSWLLQGAVALAVAELLALVGRDLLDALVWRDYVLDLENRSSTVLYFVGRSAVITVPVMVLQVFGIARLGLGLRLIAVPTRLFSRIQFAAPAAALAVLLFADLLTIQVTEAAPASFVDALGLAYNLLILVAGAVVFVLWAWIASLAYRHEARPWRWIMVGAGGIALGAVIRAIGWIAMAQWVGTTDAVTVLNWSGLAAGAFEALGAALLVVGFARGFEPIEAGEEAEIEAADPVSSPAEA